ncbi:MFS transporter [Paenibacillus sp. H1-7]|uniref:CynX/NimT family MFS transporter n=1 Tax=Paenibacillus sp. H1-7 TaxID=2282849 RepID=UPI001EF9021F|nr:MFS transporter [Paenibacillus sp. H1-7]ULL19970.1 MFS transporter [Paenibacillus sp. H1-7]
MDDAKDAASLRSSRLLLMAGVVLIAANLRASITVVGPLAASIRNDTGLSNVMTSLLTALPLIAFALISPLAPALSRRFGTERTLLGGLIALAAGIVLRSVPSATALYAGTAILGAAIAVSNVMLPALIKRDFAHQVGLMTGLYTVSMSGLAGLASGISVPMAEGLGLGWRGSLGCWALLAAAGIAVWLPQLRGAKPSLSAPAPAKAAGSLWRSPLAWQVTLFMGLQSLAFYVTIAWLPAILHDRGMSAAAAGWMLSLMQFVSLPASFIVPVLAGRTASQRGLVAFTAAASLIGYGGLLLFPAAAMVPVWIVFIGLGLGASISLALAFFALRSSSAPQAAALSGMAQSFGYLLAALGPILFGWLHDLTGGWTGPLFVLIAVIVLFFIVGLGAGRNTQLSSSSEQSQQ